MPWFDDDDEGLDETEDLPASRGGGFLEDHEDDEDLDLDDEDDDGVRPLKFDDDETPSDEDGFEDDEFLDGDDEDDDLDIDDLDDEGDDDDDDDDWQAMGRSPRGPMPERKTAT